MKPNNKSNHPFGHKNNTNEDEYFSGNESAGDHEEAEEAEEAEEDTNGKSKSLPKAS
jgi:hypothetical protein